VGAAGTADNHGTSAGGGASAVLAEDSAHALLAKLVIAGGGGGGAYDGDGGDAGSPGNSDNAQAVSEPGQAGTGATGGAGGSGNDASGTSGGSDMPSALAIAGGGDGGRLPGGLTGGGGAGGYGGGGGGGSSDGIISKNVAGGGGGSSLASAYLGNASIAVLPGTGGIQLPGYVAGDGNTGTVTLTFDGQTVPAAPTGVSVLTTDTGLTITFTAPNDGGSPITGYQVSLDGGMTWATLTTSQAQTAVTGTVTGLTADTGYNVQVRAVNALGSGTSTPTQRVTTRPTPPAAPAVTTSLASTGSNPVPELMLVMMLLLAGLAATRIARAQRRS
jgi:hypothetical protein